ncbi:MAG: phosphatase PAP2 family protein [Acidimicrobiia bacterium]
MPDPTISSPLRRRWAALALAAAVAVVAAACSDDGGGGGASADDERRAAEPTAGRWRTWVLGSPTEVPVPPPPAGGSAEAAADEAELRQLAADRTPEVEDIVRKWAGDGEPVSAPWVEMALEFVSAREKDPPNASRAYALVSVAAYDAVVAAWHWKYEYDREAPEVVERLSPAGPDPSYPSEHAAVAGAASVVLAYLFPERPALRLEEAADQAGLSRVQAGANWPSDVAAGLDLGRAIGQRVVDHARADGPDREWDGVRPGGPPRWWAPPPGSVANPVQPLAGTWGTWVMTSGDQFRPPPPPVFGSPEFRAQAEEVVRVKGELTEEQRRTATFWAGGQGTPLPPGIWNQVALAYLRDLRPSEPQAERAMALANVALADAGVAAWDAKYAYWDPRPENGVRDLGIDPTWTPYIETPFFPSYISGHATYSGAAAEVLAHLFPDNEADFRSKADEAADSRLWGGIHWRKDNEVGLEVGTKVGRLVVERAEADGAPPIAK